MSKTNYTPPSLDKKAQAAVDRGDFDFLLPFQKPVWRTDEVADAIGRSIQFVRKLIEDGRLEAHQNAAYGTRKTNLVTRRSVLLYQASTSNYDSAHLVIAIEVVCKRLSVASLDRLLTTLRRQRERMS